MTNRDQANLIERLKEAATSRETISHDEYGAKKALGLLGGRDKLIAEAATALASSATRIAELEEARAEQWRLRREAEGSRDACKAACDTMRIERDETRSRLATTQSELDEARGALSSFIGLVDGKNLGPGKKYIDLCSPRAREFANDIRLLLSSLTRTAGGDGDDDHVCPICLKPFEPADLCASDIELGTCHAACVEGSPTVDLDTGEPVDGPIPTYRYDEVSKP